MAKQKLQQHRIRILCLLLGCLSLGSVKTQTLQQEFYSVNEGLSARTVTDIVLSRYGFTWVATTNGLNRFDGYRFEAFTDDAEMPNDRRLSAGYIKELSEAKSGDLVIIYNNKPAFFDILDPLSNRVQHVEILPEKNVVGRPLSIKVDHEGRIYVVTATNSETLLYEYREGFFELNFRIDDTWFTDFPYLELLHLQEGGFLLFDEEHGLRQLSEDGEVLHLFNMEDFDRTAVSPEGRKSLYYLSQSKSGRVYLSFFNQKGLYWWLPGEESFKLCPLVEKDAYYTIWNQDDRGNVLLAEGAPLGDFPKTDQLFCITPKEEIVDFNHLLSVSSFIITTGSHNYFRTLFIGIDTGVKIVQNSLTGVKSFLRNNLAEYERGVVMRGMCQDTSGYIYMAREAENWYRLDPQTDLVDTLVLQDEETGEILNFNCSLELIYDPNGFLWGTSCPPSGTRTGRLHRYDLQTCMTKTFKFPYAITCLDYDENGEIWVGYGSEYEAGLAVFDPETENFQTITDNKGRNFLAGPSVPRYLMVDHNDNLWIGTENGLFLYDPASETVKSWDVRDQGKTPIFSNNTIYVIHEDKDGKIWLGTEAGLNIFDPITEEVKTYNTEDGLASSTICGIIPDDNGTYWISTFNGLSFFDPENGDFMRFYRTDGFNNDEFNRFSFHRDDNGRFYVGGVNGLNAFYPQDLLQYRETPPVVLTRFSSYNSWHDSTFIQADELHGLEEIVLAPYDKYFTLDFTLPVYTRPNRNKFRAQLVNYDKTWQNLGDQHSVRYDNLPAGSYSLLLQGADPNGNWSSQSLVIPVLVKEKFFNKLWVRLTGLFIGFGLVYLVFQRRLQARLREEHLRMRLSSDLHDEVSGLLGGIAMQSDLLAMRAKDSELRDRIQTIGEVSRKAMTKMSDVIWSIDSRKDRVGDLLNRMQQHADDVLLPVDIRYSFQVEKLDKEKLMPANIRQDIYFFFKEVVNNIAKHAKADRVQIKVANTGSQFELLVKDNGIGGQQNGLNGSSKTGQGLSNLYMRAQRLNADLNIDRVNGYTVSLKMKKFTK